MSDNDLPKELEELIQEVKKTNKLLEQILEKLKIL